ncbi:IMPACT family protein [Clostridium aminobutyricum]|uniref:YigZ family protein n=1 Tax=Clostridium aminobutyricum TaxID=33953 RepID=A0A939D6M5_CLOAM|nr:YigZ family protein [Clostridium aminobutyricum]MBN7772040.1 YigZ family protein [Clostridium aminobutyricum]
MIRYNTILKAASVEQIIDKSKFIASVCPVENKVEADAFIAEIRSKYKDATHNVPAMVIGDKFQIQWASDDGEPQGTAGAPIVQMLVKEGVTNLAVVVTRYFGGIKLGTGGLVRAYTSSAKLGLSEAGLCAVKDMHVVLVKLDYTYLSKLQNLSQSEDFEIQHLIYEDAVTAQLCTDPENEFNLKEMLSNLTGGTVLFLEQKVEQIKVSIG